jgi:8-amino-3,8-dideoxy-alpha-D-manno-octulosonate transaminase
MQELQDFAQERGLFLIEDGAQAIGATYKGKRSGRWGDVLVLSFQLAKTVTAGEGGAVLCRDATLYARAAMFHDQGWLREAEAGAAPEPIIGENLRLTEVAAAILLEQLRKAPRMVANMRRQKKLLLREVEKIKGLELREPTDPAGDDGSGLSLFLPDPPSARFFRKALNAENIECENLYKYLAYAHRPILAQSLAARPGCSFECPRAHRRVEYRLGICPKTEALLSRAVNVPISPALKDKDRKDILCGIQKVWKRLEQLQQEPKRLASWEKV